MKPIDWHNIRPHNDSRGAGFEELGVRLVLNEGPPAAKFIRQDTPDGIDCYWELPDGSKWGWQFKYFVDSFGATQWRQIGKDIKTALKKHPKLTRYYVCTPRNLTLKMNEDWERHVAEWKALAENETGREVEFIWWGDSELIGKLFEFNKHYLLKDFFDIHRESLFSTPEPLADFIASIADFNEVKNVLDPVCRSGLLLRKVTDRTGAKSVYGVDSNPFSIEIARRIFSSSEPNMILGDVFTQYKELPDVFDLIVAHLPFGVQLKEEVQSPLSDTRFARTLDVALTLWTLDRLTENGRALLIVPSSFFSKREAKRIHQVIIDKGFRIRAAIHISERTFHQSELSSYLIIIERGTQGKMFVGEFQNDSEHQKQLLRNLRSHEPGSRLGLGILCDLDSFRGFRNLSSSELLSRLVEERGWDGWSAEELIISAQSVKHEEIESLQYGFNSCFLRMIGNFKASTELEELTQGKSPDFNRIVYLQVNPKLVDPRYLAQWFNESPVGRATLATIVSGASIPSISLGDIKELKFYLPSLEEQHRAIESGAEIGRIRAVMDERESSLWGGDGNIRDIYQKSEDGYEDWIDTLPYPLASILWRHYTMKYEPHKDRIEALLHFFEATAIFMTAVHISAFMADGQLWDETQREFIEKKNWELQKASFGTWVMALKYLIKKCGELLNDPNQSGLVQKIYSTSNEQILSMLSNPKLVKILRRANTARNKRSHDGVMSESEKIKMHNDLQGYVREIRGIFGRSWLEFKLIQPWVSDHLNSKNINDVKAKLLMGTRTPFEAIRLEFKHQLSKNELYLTDSTSQSALRLQPFIIVKQSPIPVCYFFNERNKGRKSYFVSYHSELEPKILSDAIEETFLRICPSTNSP